MHDSEADGGHYPSAERRYGKTVYPCMTDLLR